MTPPHLDLSLPPLDQVCTAAAPKLELPKTPLLLYVDGSCQPNPGAMNIGLVLIHQFETVWSHQSYAGQGTNNQAEFKAILQGMLLLEKLPKQYPDFNLPCTILTDSRVAADTFMPWKRPKSAALQPLFDEIDAVAKRLAARPAFTWVPRHLNQAADNLSKTTGSRLGRALGGHRT